MKKLVLTLAAFAALVEPAFYVTLATLGLLAGTFGLDGIVSFFATHPWETTVPLASFP